MFIDLDHFKNINDSLGHDVGDELLKQVAERMAHCLRRTDTLARLGGDEFVVLLPEIGSENEAAFVAEKLLESFTDKFNVADFQLSITPSLGISVYPDDGQDARELLRNADVAMYRAKKDGRNMFQFYRPEMMEHITERLQMEMQLRHAISRQELFVQYQPQISLETGEIAGMEALLRWQNPTLGLVSPNRFIPVAEESGLIVEIGEWVLRQACMQGRIWLAQGYELVPIAVNVSGIQFKRGQFLEKLRLILAETQLPPHLLEIEITESVLMDLGESGLEILHVLKDLGVCLALDDFGTGYSSLSRLKTFPLDFIKIDQSFVRDIDSDPNDAAIVRAVLSMAHEMDLKAIAEGVEKATQLEFLRQLACERYQGYLCSPAIAPHDITRFMKKQD